ncbi:MAG TPA: 6-carboxyhexanoate--CoA ligase [Methanothermococcus okinawensis]|uniref:6-carboxyhexanoate--CoA ligase n=1 Tax=Methanothermococcus okinawensis TaxID=155863 RepID=A0A832ZLR3_9EURY|nr:6-carboxyhexanoate--CoA ligase [Methanococcaceae archaeon]HIP84172.1 6-carboxyhexanoate--CoA ligase [Methanothermococcus okinawensis]HIP91811.1 6-carboxyhexanoate--CoA ligase [Methanothermococcus okinawensis]
MYSIKMRASKNNRHISGAETIVEREKIEEYVVKFIRRAFSHEIGTPDFINIKIEEIKEDIKYIDPLPIRTVECSSKEEARKVARDILRREGIKEEVIEEAFKILDRGGMRGASILNLEGERLEPDRERGVRVKCISTSHELKERILGEKLGTERTVDAIAIATKVIDLGVIGELCISDNPSYTTGYVATKRGYFRITNLKERGEPGGRVFFVSIPKEDRDKLERLIRDLENKPYIIR